MKQTDCELELMVPEAINGDRLVVLTALLTNPRISTAAEVAGVSRATIYRMMRDPIFNEALQDSRRALFYASFTSLTAAANKAISTLVNVMDSEESPASSKVAAARVVLESSLKFHSEDISARLNDLEDRL